VSFSDRVGPPVCVAVADEIPPEVVFLDGSRHGESHEQFV